MRIGIDCRTILNPGLGEQAGVGHYTYYLVKHLLDRDQDNEYVLFFDYRAPDLTEFEQANVKIRKFPFSQYKKFLPFGYSQVLTAAYIAKERVHVFHSPANITPLGYRGKTVITVHDLAIYINPDWFPTQHLSTKLLVPQSLKHAKRIIAVSQSTKRDLQTLFDVPAKKIVVVYEAPFTDKIALRDRNVNVRKKFGLPRPFFLFVSTLEPRKNVETLLAAFERFRKQHDGVDLVIAGGKGHRSEHVLEELQEAGRHDHVRYLGYVTHNEKLALLKEALAFVFPSLYEGFGLQVAEAMQMGLPVITSNVSSLPEVMGKAGILVKPNDVRAIVRAMEKVAGSEQVRAAMSEKGKQQAAQFTWDRVAEETLAVYEKVANGKGGNGGGKKKRPLPVPKAGRG